MAVLLGPWSADVQTEHSLSNIACNFVIATVKLIMHTYPPQADTPILSRHDCALSWYFIKVVTIIYQNTLMTNRLTSVVQPT